MNKINFVLQAKGGIGKSYTASLLAQYLKPKSSNLLILDIDQENPTLSQFGGLNVERVNVMGSGHGITPLRVAAVGVVGVLGWVGFQVVFSTRLESLILTRHFCVRA